MGAVDEGERDLNAVAVTRAEHVERSARDQATTATPASPRKRRRIALLAGLVLLVGVSSWWVLRQSAPKPAVDELYVVAPVGLDHADAETAWVRLGVMDYIATRLREDGRLSVLPSSRVVALLSQDRVDPAEVGKDLLEVTAASHLIEATASRRAGGWRITLNARSQVERRVFVGDGANLLGAASQAVQALLFAVEGRKPQAPVAPSDQLDESMQRIDAAMLEGNLSAARAVVAELPPDRRESPQIRVREGQILFRGGRIDEADSVYSALEARLVQWPTEVQAQTLMGLGAVAVRRRDFGTAERRYAEALAALGEQGGMELVGNGYNGRGVARAAQQQFDLALGDFSRARIALARAGDAPGVASIDTNLGLLEARRGQWTQALQAFDRAIDVFSRYRVQDNLAAALLGKSRVQLALVDFGAALQTSEHARELAADLENPVLGGQIGVLRANILLRTGSLSGVARLLDGLAATGPAQDAREIAIELALQNGDGEGAMRLAGEPQFDATDGRHAYLLVRAAIASHQDAQALDSRLGPNVHVDESRNKTDPAERVYSGLAHALWLDERGRSSEAAATFDRVLASMDRSIEPDLRVEAISVHVEFLVATQRLDRATELSGQLEGYADRDYRAARALALLYRALGDASLLESARKNMRDLAGERSRDLPLQEPDRPGRHPEGSP